MRKSILIAAATIAISLSGFANTAGEMAKETMTFSVSGTVVDINTGEALAGVKVEIDQAGITAYSDFDGNFVIEGLFPGVYKVNSTFISYQSSELELDLNSIDSNKLEVKMNQLNP